MDTESFAVVVVLDGMQPLSEAAVTRSAARAGDRCHDQNGPRQEETVVAVARMQEAS